MRTGVATKIPSGMSGCRIYRKNLPGPMVSYVIGDHAWMFMVMFMEGNHPMEIIENKEPREVEPSVPEWGRNPRIEIVIIRWRGIISYNRRAFGIVVVIDHRWLRVLRHCRRRDLSVFILHLSNDR
jgi:hypothetical protein